MTSISVAKHSYIRGGPNAKGKAKAHIRYIQHRGGHDKEQGPRQFFDKDDDRVSGKSIREEIDAAGERGVLIHKIILSPGVQGVDLHRYTRDLMEEIGDRKGLDLDWKAVIHGNTDHDHVHVVVMGRDRDGRNVRFDRNDYQGLRDIGDRYLERHHEFDRYFDRSLENVFKEGGTRGLDLDSLFRPYDRDDEDKDKRKKKARTDRELHERPQYTRLKEKRKPRRQRIFEARGRKERDYFHDLYQRQTSRKDLENKIEADPQNSAYYKEQLEFLNQIDADRHADIMARSAELDRILGISPAQSKQRAQPAQTAQVNETVAEPVPDHVPEPEHVAQGEDRELQEIEQKPIGAEIEKPVEQLTLDAEKQEQQSQETDRVQHEKGRKDLDEAKQDIETIMDRTQETKRKADESERKLKEEEERDR